MIVIIALTLGILGSVSLIVSRFGNAESIPSEHYSLPFSVELTIGTPLKFVLTGSPDTSFKPKHLVTNAPGPGFVSIIEIKLANVSMTLSNGVEDAFFYNPLAKSSAIEGPTLLPANRASIICFYSGHIPPGRVMGESFTFSASFNGTGHTNI